MTYSFRNRFKVKEHIFQADAHEYLLADSPAEGRVVLRAARQNERISEANELAVEGSGYPDFDAARDAGRKWRQWMISALARDMKAAEFGDEDDERLAVEWESVATNPADLLTSIGIKSGDLITQDRIGLLVFKTEPARRFLIFAMGTPTISQGIEVFLEGPLKAARERAYAPWDERQKLAYALVHSALFDAEPETRYIQLVTAIEALLPDTKRPPEVLSVMESLKATVKNMDDIGDESRSRVLQILGDNRESIARRGEAFVSKLEKNYDGMTPVQFFKACYKKRSDLVHGNLPVPDVKQYRRLLEFVLDLLDVYSPADGAD
jgi:hypothetical protein